MAVPLSDREQRILAEIERELSVEDPRWARTITADDAGSDSPRSLRRGILLFVAGIGLLIGFLVSRLLIVGIAAFGLMVAGLVIGVGAVVAWAKGRLEEIKRRYRHR